MLYMLVLGYSVAYIFDGRTVTAAAVLLAMYFVECVAVSFVVYDFYVSCCSILLLKQNN